VTIDDNVAYKTRGHCYVLEDGTEIDNSFRHNLGAETMDLGADNGQSDSNENGSVTFWMRNIKNHWIDNVAAGSKGVTPSRITQHIPLLLVYQCTQGWD